MVCGIAHWVAQTTVCSDAAAGHELTGEIFRASCVYCFILDHLDNPYWAFRRMSLEFTTRELVVVGKEVQLFLLYCIILLVHIFFHAPEHLSASSFWQLIRSLMQEMLTASLSEFAGPIKTFWGR